MSLALNTWQLFSQTVFYKSEWSLPGMKRFTVSLQTNHPQFRCVHMLSLSDVCIQSWMRGFATRFISYMVLQDSLSLFVFHLFWGAFSLPLALCRRWWPFFSCCTGMGHWRLWGRGSALDRYRPCQGHISSLISANFGWAFQLCLFFLPPTQSVITYYTQRGLDEYMRSSLALDWLGWEQRSPGRLAEELQVAQRELVLARRRGIELRFYKEKTAILSLALSQAYIHHTPEAFSQVQSHSYKQELLPLHPLYSQDTKVQITPPCSPSPSLHKNTKQTVCQASGKHTPSNSPSSCSQETFVPINNFE